MIRAIKKILFLIERRFTSYLIADSRPVFVVGCGHSGTSLLLAILGTHSRIYPVPFESKLGYKFFGKFFYLWKFRSSAITNGKRRWVEKTPKHIHRIEELLNLGQGIKILIILRDGRDVACSYKNRFGNIESGIHAWINDNKVVRKYRDHPEVMILKYEDLVSSFEVTVKEVFHFIGEEFESATLAFHTQPKYFYSKIIEKPDSVQGENHNQYRNWQINQPLFDGSGKWHSLLADEKNYIKEMANDMLVEFGYVKNAEW